MKAKGRVFLLDDDDLIVSMLARALKGEGYDVHPETDPNEAVDKIRSFSPDVVMLDLKLPGKSGMDILKEILERGIAAQVIMLTSDDTAETAVRAMKLGAADYLTKPFDMDEVKLVIASIMEKGKLRSEVEYLRKISSDLAYKEIIGSSAVIHKLKEKARKLAQAGVPTVLITGENGTGKELFARYIHHAMYGENPGSYAPFVGINCAALPEPLIESELFGHEKGSFTGATEKQVGKFEQADRGTIFLDEVSDMSAKTQAKVLRVLQEGEVERLGSSRTTKVDVRVIAATNKNLEEEIEKGHFREDLYFRLAVIPIHVPPLRERPEDIPLLVRHYMEFFSRENNVRQKRITQAALDAMARGRWKGRRHSRGAWEGPGRYRGRTRRG